MAEWIFSQVFIFGPQDFFADFVAGFLLLIFVGKSALKNPPGKYQAKSSKIYTTKIPDTFLPRGRAKNLARNLRQISATPPSQGLPKGVFVRGGNLNNWGGPRTGCNNEFCVKSLQNL